MKLLRVLQEREFDRVGGRPDPRDVRVIAATNRDLLKEVHEGTFREDLFYRLNVFPVRLPPLRERRDDIPSLVHFLVKKFALRIGKHLDGVSRATMQRLMEYPWPGNIRELENVLERAIILASEDVLEIGPDLLPLRARPPPPGNSLARTRTPQPPSGGAATNRRPAATQPGSRGTQLYPHRPPTDQLGHHRPPRRGGSLDLHPSTLRNRMKKLGITAPPTTSGDLRPAATFAPQATTA